MPKQYMRKPYVGIVYYVRDELRVLLTGLPKHVVLAHAVVTTHSYKRAAELLHESRLAVRITERQVNSNWNVSGVRVHLEFAEEGESVYLCKNDRSSGVREDYVKAWPCVVATTHSEGS
jgi:enoyl-CoA hydratase/carnithine racemase